jgi:hypothetical protein
MDEARDDAAAGELVPFRSRRRFVAGLLGGVLASVTGGQVRGDRVGAAPRLRWPPRPTPVPSPTSATALDDETLQRLVIFSFAPDEEPHLVPVDSLDTTIELLSGGTVILTLGVFACCYVFQPVPARAAWSIAPSEGARLDPESGLLTVDPSVPSGSVFIVTASIEDGRRLVTADVVVFTLQSNPLVGYWREQAQLDCATGAEVVPEHRIAELVFNADGTFAVTWYPFEVYHDYWGKYTFDLTRGVLDLEVEDGNYVPSNLDGHGRFAFDADGRLILREVWLGMAPDGHGPPNCGHIFMR